MILVNISFFFLILYSISFTYFREIGPIIILLILFVSTYSLIIIKLDKTFLYFLKKYLGFLIYSTLILIFSIFELMPSSWTEKFDLTISLRQYFFIFSLPIFTFVSYEFFKKYFNHIDKKIFIILIFFIFIYLIINKDINRIILSPFTNTSQILILLFLLSFKKIKSYFFKLFFLILLLPLAFLNNGSLQFLLFIFGLIIIYLNINRYFIHKLIIFSFIAIPIFSDFIINNLIDIFDANSQVRLVLWRDATIALMDSYGLGVGFGTEWIKNQFDIINPGWELFQFYDFNKVHNTTTHNTFSDIYFRLGIIGIILFLLFLFSFFSKKEIESFKLSSEIFFAILLSLSTNPGFFSLNFSLGLCISLGLILYLKIHKE